MAVLAGDDFLEPAKVIKIYSGRIKIYSGHIEDVLRV
jgi:hypothetical protein